MSKRFEKEFLEFCDGFRSKIEESNVEWPFIAEHKVLSYLQIKNNIKQNSVETEYSYEEEDGEVKLRMSTFFRRDTKTSKKIKEFFFVCPKKIFISNNSIGTIYVYFTKDITNKTINYEFGKLIGKKYSELYNKISDVSFEHEVIESIILFILASNSYKNNTITINFMSNNGKFSVSHFFTESKLYDIVVENKYMSLRFFQKGVFSPTYIKAETNNENLKLLASGKFPGIDLDI